MILTTFMSYMPLMALTPAFIAKEKGYSFVLWWFIGMFSPPIAIFCICKKENLKLMQAREEARKESWASWCREEAKRKAQEQKQQGEKQKQYAHKEQQRREQERRKWNEQQQSQWQKQDNYHRTHTQQSSSNQYATFDFFRGCSNWEQIEKRYKKLQQAYHPDSGCGDVETAKDLNMAFEQLKKKYGK